MNQRIRELAKQSGGHGLKMSTMGLSLLGEDAIEKFAQLIVQECVSNLEFHGFEDAVPYIKWMATNKLGVKP